jgi:hypothetical protein
MARQKRNDLVKVTLNLRDGDFNKMGELFPEKGPSVAIRELLSAFIDKHYGTVPVTE